MADSHPQRVETLRIVISPSAELARRRDPKLPYAAVLRRNLAVASLPKGKKRLPLLSSPLLQASQLAAAFKPSPNTPTAKKRKSTKEAAAAAKQDVVAPAPASDADPASAVASPATPPFRNKEKVLVTCSRRITFRYRHLMQDLVSLLPHAKKDSMVESKQSKGTALNELIELRSCSSCLFFEKTKRSLSLDGQVPWWSIGEISG